MLRKLEPKETLAEQAYRMLKEDIVKGNLAPNEELPEEKLAAYLGISRTPLREALTRLAMDGLIVIQKGRPAIVATFTKEESLHYMEIRRVLEVYNIEKVTAKIDDGLLKSLDENLKRQLKAVQSGSFHEFIELDREFHLVLASKNSNAKIRDLIHQMNTGVNRAFLILSNTLSFSAEEAYEEHVELVEALKSGDVSLAKEKMLLHLINVEKRFLIYYQ